MNATTREPENAFSAALDHELRTILAAHYSRRYAQHAETTKVVENIRKGIGTIPIAIAVSAMRDLVSRGRVQL